DDVLIGGAGRDLLVGGAGSDLLIGGGTAFDGNVAALGALRATWASGCPYAARLGDLAAWLSPATAPGDGAAGGLAGGGGRGRGGRAGGRRGAGRVLGLGVRPAAGPRRQRAGPVGPAAAARTSRGRAAGPRGAWGAPGRAGLRRPGGGGKRFPSPSS